MRTPEEAEAAVEFLRQHFPEEELLPELKPFLYTDPRLGWQILKHRYIFSIPHSDAMNHHVNRAYQMKCKLIREAKKNGDWYSYVFLHERPYRAEALKSVQRWIRTGEEYWPLLRAVWIDSENLYQWGRLIRDLLFAGRPERDRWLMDEHEGMDVIGMPVELTVYRGHDKLNRSGWSWTLDRDIAVWFARRFSDAPLVTTGMLPKEKLIAYFTSRNECEVVANPADVRVDKTENVR